MYDAYKTYCDANDGSFSTVLHMPRPEFGEAAVAYAAEQLTALREGREHMIDRTFHVTSAQTEVHRNKVNTGLKVFDDQANRSGGFMTGNAITNVQHSNYVRPVNMLVCNGLAFEPGELRKFDMKMFQPDRIDLRTSGDAVYADKMSAVVADKAFDDEMLIVYQVLHTVRDGSRKTHGWVVTKADGELVAKVACDTGARTTEILRQATACFTMATVEGSERPLLKVDGGKLTFADPEVVKASEMELGPMEPVADEPATDDRPRDRG